MKKLLKWTFLLVVLVVVGGGVVLFFTMNGLVERAIERNATQSLNLDTQLSGAKLAPFGGTLDLDGLEIASPEGFQAPYLLTLGEADVAVSMGQLRKDPMHIKSVTLTKPKLVIERGAGGEVNFKKAVDLMPKTEESTESEPMKVVIDELTVNSPSVELRPGLPGLAEQITIDIPTVTLKNIGTGEGAENGAALKDVAMQLITVMAAEAASSDKLSGQLQAMLKAKVGEVVAGLKGEAQQRIREALPGEAGVVVAGFIDDPEAAKAELGKMAEKAAEDQIRQGAEQLEDGVRKAIPGKLRKGSGLFQDDELDRAEEDAGGEEDGAKSGGLEDRIGKGIGGLIGGGGDDDSADEDEKGEDGKQSVSE